MKLTRLLVSSALLLSTSLSVLANSVSDVGDSIKFVVNSTTIPAIPVVDGNYSYKNFLYGDFKVVNSNNGSVNTFSPNLSGPYPGQTGTSGKFGVGVQTGVDQICHVSLKALLISNGHPVNFVADGTPSVKS